MASNVFQLEIAAALAGRRSMMIRLGFTWLLGLPFILVDMPLRVKVSGLSVIIIFIAFFGAAVTYVRRKTEGKLERLKILPIPGWRITGDMILAGALMDCIQMFLLLLLFFMTLDVPVTFVAVLKITGLFITSVLLFNLLGILLALTVKDNSEVHLFGVLGAILLAFLSGLFPVSERLQPMTDLAGACNPLTIMVKDLIRLSEGRFETLHELAAPWIIVMFLFITVTGWRFMDISGKVKP